MQGLYKVREKFDSCFDKIGPSVIVTIEPIWKELIELKKRAGKIRLLTEITKDNIPFCKELMKIGELRHFDGVKVNFAILDGKEYQATIIHEESEPVASCYGISIQYPDNCHKSENNLPSHCVVKFSAPDVKDKESKHSISIFIPVFLVVPANPSTISSSCIQKSMPKVSS